MYKVFALIFLLSTPLWSDELIVVKAVAQDRKTFSILKGEDEGIHLGQKRTFSTEKITFVARAIDVHDTISVWRMEEKNSAVPFGRDQVVTLNTSSESIWSEISRLEFTNKERLREMALMKKNSESWIVRAGFSRALTENTSDVPTDEKPERKGYTIEGMYTKPFPDFFQLEWGLGLRFDRETCNIQNPSLTIPTNRMIAMGELNYSFERFKGTEGFIYLGVATGYGRSETTISESVSTGAVLALPIVRLGYSTSWGRKTSILVEAVVESLSGRETFTDGVAQNSSVTNSKLAFGIRF